MAPKGFKRQPHVAQALNKLGKYFDAHEDEAMPCLLVVLAGRFNQSKSSSRDSILAYAKVDRGTLSTAMVGNMIRCVGSSLPR